MQEQVNERNVAISVKAVKITGALLAKAIQAYLRSRGKLDVKHGRQSLKSLAKHGASLTNIPLSDDNIASFNQTARKYNIDYSLKKDLSETPPRWVVFFKAKDADSLMTAFKEYSKSQLEPSKKKPSVLAALKKALEKAKLTAPPEKNHRKGDHEL
jgi:hypothetical protein